LTHLVQYYCKFSADFDIEKSLKIGGQYLMEVIRRTKCANFLGHPVYYVFNILLIIGNDVDNCCRCDVGGVRCRWTRHCDRMTSSCYTTNEGKWLLNSKRKTGQVNIPTLFTTLASEELSCTVLPQNATPSFYMALKSVLLPGPNCTQSTWLLLVS